MPRADKDIFNSQGTGKANLICSGSHDSSTGRGVNSCFEQYDMDRDVDVVSHKHVSGGYMLSKVTFLYRQVVLKCLFQFAVSSFKSLAL